MPLPEVEQKKIRDEAENYTSTVQSLLAFAAFVVHDGSKKRSGSHFGSGRRMEASTGVTVTPDLAAQKSDSYGVVAEVKRSLPKNEKYWRKVLEQLSKYDRGLTGWWTSDEEIETADTVLLVHHTRSRAFVRYLEGEIENDPGCVGTCTSVVEFNRSDEATVFFFFRKEWGEIRDLELGKRLVDGVSIPFGSVLRSLPNLKFYDAPPPMPHLLSLLWMDTFAALAAEHPYDENVKATPIEVSASAIAAEMQKAYGSQLLEVDERAVPFPSTTVIQQALQALVSLKLALPLDSDRFKVMYKEFRDDVLQRFGELLFTEHEEMAEGQTSLFDEADDKAPPLEDGTGNSQSEEAEADE